MGFERHIQADLGLKVFVIWIIGLYREKLNRDTAPVLTRTFDAFRIVN